MSAMVVDSAGMREGERREDDGYDGWKKPGTRCGEDRNVRGRSQLVPSPSVASAVSVGR